MPPQELAGIKPGEPGRLSRHEDGGVDPRPVTSRQQTLLTLQALRVCVRPPHVLRTKFEFGMLSFLFGLGVGQV